MRTGIAAALVLGLAATAAQAALFDGLFAFTKTETSAPLPDDSDAQVPDFTALGPRTDAGVCIAAIRQAEAAYGLPTDLLLAIGLQEAGMSYKGSMTIWPWSLNVEGRGYRFDSREEAEAFLAGELAEGRRSIDVGCLQVNLRWHPDAFPSPDAGFDPARNADYAARFLRGLYLETGDWLQAAGHYHSATPDLKDLYLAGIEKHLSRLNHTAASFDALAAQAVPAQDGMFLTAGVTLDAPALRRMNPLRAPVRQDLGVSSHREVYRRTLLVLARPAENATDPLALSVQAGTGWSPDESGRGGSLFAPLPSGDGLNTAGSGGLDP